VLNLIKSSGPISRTEIARLSGLSQAAVSSIVTDLIESGLVHETGEGESTGGRKPVLLRINDRAGFVVGVKLTEQAITSALTDLDANVIYAQTVPIPGQCDLQAVQEAIVTTIETTIARSGVDPTRVLGIGLGMAGVVDGGVGVCRYSPFFGWWDVPLASSLTERLGIPVYLENDVNTLTIAEQWFGYGHGVDHFVVVTVGRGIGAGIVVNGQFYRGAIGGAGELGHIPLVQNGPPCACGKHGCLEALASDPAVVRQARAAIARGEPSMLTDVVAMLVACAPRPTPTPMPELPQPPAAPPTPVPPPPLRPPNRSLSATPTGT